MGKRRGFRMVWGVLATLTLGVPAEAITLNGGGGLQVLHLPGKGDYGNRWDLGPVWSWEAGIWAGGSRNRWRGAEAGMYLNVDGWYAPEAVNRLGSSVLHGDFRGTAGTLGLVYGKGSADYFLGLGYEKMGAGMDKARGIAYSDMFLLEQGLLFRSRHFYLKPLMRLGLTPDLYTGQVAVLRYGVTLGLSLQ